MPGALLTAGTTVLCAHGAPAQPTAPVPRVLVMGQPVVTQPPPYVVGGCPNVTPVGAPLPCVSASWITAATRVTAMGQPVLLADSQAIASPTGTPLTIVPAPSRVTGI
jgi:hypothetical protein